MSQFVLTSITPFSYRQASTGSHHRITFLCLPCQSLYPRTTDVLQASGVYHTHSHLCAFPSVVSSAVDTPFPDILGHRSSFPSRLSSSINYFPDKTVLPPDAPRGIPPSQRCSHDYMSSSPAVVASLQESPQGSPPPGTQPILSV